MKLKTGWLGPAVVSAFTLAVACGGSSGDNNSEGGSGGSSAGKGGSTSGGSTSTAGTTSGGSTSTAGKTSGGTGGSGASGGSRNQGGSTNTGGIDIGFGGFDPGDYACDPVPEDGAECEAGTTPCLDGTKVCYCQNQEWACTDLGGFGGTNAGGGSGPIGNIECPDAKPTSGTPCGDAVGFCPYGDGINGCACYQGSWACVGG